MGGANVTGVKSPSHLCMKSLVAFRVHWLKFVHNAKRAHAFCIVLRQQQEVEFVCHPPSNQCIRSSTNYRYYCTTRLQDIITDCKTWKWIKTVAGSSLYIVIDCCTHYITSGHTTIHVASSSSLLACLLTCCTHQYQTSSSASSTPVRVLAKKVVNNTLSIILIARSILSQLLLTHLLDCWWTSISSSHIINRPILIKLLFFLSSEHPKHTSSWVPHRLPILPRR